MYFHFIHAYSSKFKVQHIILSCKLTYFLDKLIKREICLYLRIQPNIKNRFLKHEQKRLVETLVLEQITICLKLISLWTLKWIYLIRVPCLRLCILISPCRYTFTILNFGSNYNYIYWIWKSCSQFPCFVVMLIYVFIDFDRNCI